MRSSERKIRANRENARRSTGPRTVEGKQAIRLNALRHGVFAKDALIQKGDGKEDVAEFQELLDALKADLAPVGVLECMLVERIMTAFWRLRRVVRFETASLRANLDDAAVKRSKRRRDAFQRAVVSFVHEGGRERLYESSLGIRQLIALLEQVRDDVISTGHIASELAHKLIKFFPGHDLSRMCPEFVSGPPSSLAGLGPSVEDEVPEGVRVQFLEDLHCETMRLESLMRSASRREKLGDERYMALSGVPSRETMEQVCRYETTVERQLFRALAELERLQRRRRENEVPARMAVGLVAGK